MITNIFCLLNNNYIFDECKIQDKLLNNNDTLQTNVPILKNYFKYSVSVDNNFLSIDGIDISCNGQIYNYKKLFDIINITPTTYHSYEIIIYLYKLYGIEQTLNLIDGDFTFILIDTRLTSNDTTGKIYIARDPYGLKPLYYLKSTCNVSHHIREQIYLYAISSDILILKNLYDEKIQNYIEKDTFVIKEFMASTYSSFEITINSLSSWRLVVENRYFYMPSGLNINIFKNDITNEKYVDYCDKMNNYLDISIVKRIGCTNTTKTSFLLTSDISSILLACYFVKMGINLHFFSIGFKNSDDLNYINKIACFLKITHTEITITEEEYKETYNIIFNNFNNIANKLYNIYDNNTNKIDEDKIFIYLFSEYLKKNTNTYYIYTSFGGNELFGLINENNNILNDNILLYDKIIRNSIKNISKSENYIFFYNSMKIKNIVIITPFLDKLFVDFYISSHLIIDCSNNDKNIIIPYNFLKCLPLDVIDFEYSIRKTK